MAEVYAGALLGYYEGRHGDGDTVSLARRLGAWLHDVEATLGTHLSAPLRVAIQSAQAPLRGVLSEAGRRALRLLAAYAECSDLEWPTELPASLETDPAWRRVRGDDFARCHFPQIQIPDFWLAGDFAFTARQAMPDGDTWILGALDGLLEQLTKLNQQTLQFAAADLTARLESGVDLTSTDFLAHAEYAMASLTRAAVRAQEIGGVLIWYRSQD